MGEVNGSIKTGQIDLLATLLSRPECLEAIRGSRPSEDRDGWSAIHLAAAKDYTCLKMVVEAGADPNALARIPGIYGFG